MIDDVFARVRGGKGDDSIAGVATAAVKFERVRNTAVVYDRDGLTVDKVVAVSRYDQVSARRVEDVTQIRRSLEARPQSHQPERGVRVRHRGNVYARIVRIHRSLHQTAGRARRIVDSIHQLLCCRAAIRV